MGKIAISSGGAGDIIFSIPIFRALGVTDVIIKESFYPLGWGSLYSCMKPLLESQGFAVHPCKDEGLGFDQFPAGVKYDYNMDAWRSCRMRGKWHIMTSMANYWRVRANPRVPWMNIRQYQYPNPYYQWEYKNASEYPPTYTLWSLTPRWRESDCNWKAVFHSVAGIKVFTGFEEDFISFCDLVEGRGNIYHIKTKDFLELAAMVADCQALYCNQGLPLAIAQAIGKNYYCAFKKFKTNCYTRTPNEHCL